MSYFKTLERSISQATDIINRLRLVSDSETSEEETKAIFKMKAQVEILVTDLSALFAQPEQDNEEIERLQGLLQKMDEITSKMVE